MKPASPDTSPGTAARCALVLVRFYQRFLSGMKPPTCRYYPTCSEYAAEAIRHRGLIHGCLLAGWRLLRCNPFSPGGYDPGPWATEPAGHDSPVGAVVGDTGSGGKAR